MTTGETPICRRCLLQEFAEGKKLYELIQEVLEAIPEGERAAEAVYHTFHQEEEAPCE